MTQRPLGKIPKVEGSQAENYSPVLNNYNDFVRLQVKSNHQGNTKITSTFLSVSDGPNLTKPKYGFMK